MFGFQPSALSHIWPMISRFFCLCIVCYYLIRKINNILLTLHANLMVQFCLCVYSYIALGLLILVSSYLLHKCTSSSIEKFFCHDLDIFHAHF